MTLSKRSRSDDNADMQTGHLIGIRVDPDTEVAEWFTIWFEDQEGRNRVAATDGRVQWARAALQASNFAEGLTGRYEVGSEVESVCDVAGSLYAIASGESGSEGSRNLHDAAAQPRH